MKLLENYANSCSVDIKHKPFLFEKFFPLGDVNKYITLQSNSAMAAKNYSYFEEVVMILKPILDKENIKIVHLGQDSVPIFGTINLNNQTSINQAYYLIKRSLLHAGVDSWMIHAACAEEVPCVALYGSTTVENHSPYHFNPEKSIFIESHRNGAKASFQREENPKTVDFINAENVAAAICKLLGIKFDYPYKTLNIGPSFNNKMLESACYDVINLNQIGLQNIIMRLDYNFNLAVLMNQLSIAKCSIVTDQPIPLNILQQFKPNIMEIVYKITKKHNPNFVKELVQNKIPYRLFSELAEHELNVMKLDYLDYNIIVRRIFEKPKVLDGKDLSKIYYKSSKLTIGAGGKIYQSQYDLKNGRNIPSLMAEPQQLINDNPDLLWKENEYFLFLEKLDNPTNLL